MKLTPFLGYQGQTHEAFLFYTQALGGMVTSQTRYRDMPDMDGGPMDPGMLDHVGHSQLEAGAAVLMAADSCADPADAGLTTINIAVDSIEEAERVFAAMSAGGRVRMPLLETFWAHRWGWFIDRYGKPWMVNCMKQ